MMNWLAILLSPMKLSLFKFLQSMQQAIKLQVLLTTQQQGDIHHQTILFGLTKYLPRPVRPLKRANMLQRMKAGKGSPSLRYSSRCDAMSSVYWGHLVHPKRRIVHGVF